MVNKYITSKELFEILRNHISIPYDAMEITLELKVEHPVKITVTKFAEEV